MIWFLALLIIGLAAAAATALIRGLFAFHEDGVRLKEGGEKSDIQRGSKQNRMMAQRVFYQGLAIVVVVILGSAAAQS